MQKSIEKIIVDILKHELDLPDNYGKTARGDEIPTVIIYAQNIKLFNTDKMQITVKTVSSRNYSNRTTFKSNPNPIAEDGSDAFIEVQDINQQRMMQVDVYSRNNEARERYWEVAAALNSVYAQQQEELYNFKIATITSDTNISGVDGGSDINRFSTTFNVLIHFQKTKTIDYYNKFPATFNNENGQFANFE